MTFQLIKYVKIDPIYNDGAVLKPVVVSISDDRGILDLIARELRSQGFDVLVQLRSL